MGRTVAGKSASRTPSAGKGSKPGKSSSRKKPGKGVLYEISLTAKLDSAGRVVFEPSNNFWNKAKNTFEFSKDKHPGMRTADYHLVEFRLEDDKTGLNLRFPTEARDAMWVVNRPECPVPTDPCDYDVARPLAVIDDRTLLALNLNQKVGKFGFRLNFIGNGSPEYVPWDPIGDNNNGGIQR